MPFLFCICFFLCILLLYVTEFVGGGLVMTLIDFSRDLEIVLREVSYTFSCNTSKVDCRLTSKEGAEASFTAYGYGSGVCAIDEVNKYIR